MRRCIHCGAEHVRDSRYCSECEFMSVEEVQKRLHISKPTYYRYVKAGRIKTRQFGPRKILISRADVDALLSR